MAGAWRLTLCVVASLLVASSASAGGRVAWWSSPPTVSYYYYEMPMTYWYYCPPVQVQRPRVIPVPDALPKSAPPSTTNEPPLQKKTSNDARMPVITASHSADGNYVPGNAPLAKDRCRVGFWNLSGRDVTLMIDGKSWKLAKDRAITVDLERQFAWQVEGQPQHVERVGEGQSAYEVVIRE
jgi:hypothetical protein